MDNVGAEVGQKMRSAVKAKLMELGCYVDDELPDYIMVMVANKRTKSQMNQDLELFLNNKTSTFVDWLHIVLKKLEEITVTNTAVLKKISKRKSGTSIKTSKVKREKKDKTKSSKKSKMKLSAISNVKVENPAKSLTDDLPVKANKRSEVRKIVIMKESNGSSNVVGEEDVVEDNFDIPTLSEVSNESELAEIQNKIKSVKSRLGLQVASGSEDDDCINLKADPDDLFSSDVSNKEKRLKEEILRKISMLEASIPEDNASPASPTSDVTSKDRNEHPRITYAAEHSETPVKRTSALERLGKRSDTTILEDRKRKRVTLSETRREEEEILGTSKTSKLDDSRISNKTDKSVTKDNKRTGTGEVFRESALKRLGLMSKVAVPHKEMSLSNNEDESEDLLSKDVPSTVKVKPRPLPPSSKQANKNLLLKAVADAQRSVAQTPIVGNKSDAIYTKKYKDNVSSLPLRKLSTKDKNNIRNMLVSAVKQDKKDLDFSSDDDNLEYIPKPIIQQSKTSSHPEYIPSSRGHSSDDCDNLDGNDMNSSFPKQTRNQTFIITLDGISRNQDVKNSEVKKDVETNNNKKRKAPSPIIFDSTTTTTVTSKGKVIPDSLSSVTSPTSLKTKERCRFWPTCRQGEKCEFIHPNTSCRAFPNCKFGDKCLYIHPTCKFELSCTRKDCQYSHAPKSTFSSAKKPATCKFFPNCNNIHCSFYHPKPCKYGKHCKNLQLCTFSHKLPSKSSLTWRSTVTP